MSINFLSWAIKNKISKNIIVSGSCLEYGKKSGLCNESSKVVFPSNNLGWSKLCILYFLNKLKKSCKFNLYWLRLFYVYGKYQRRDSLLPYLIRSFKKKYPKIKNLNTSQDFIHIDDVTNFILNIIKSRKIRKLSGIYNLGSGKLIYIKDIVNKFNFFLKCYQKKEKGIYANTKKAKKNFLWKPHNKILENITQIVNNVKTL